MMNIDAIKLATADQWDTILQHVAGLSKAETTPTKTGMPCPNCAGTDRYEFKQTHDGYYLCRGCGAGDGWSMVMKRLNVDFMGAVQQVAQYLKLDDGDAIPVRAPQPRPEPKPAADHQRIAHKAQALWQRASLDPVDHPYLLKKRLPPLKLRQYGDSLVSPVFDRDRQLVNLQFIRPDGKKHFLKGGQSKGCFQWWGPWDGSWSVYVCEGVADALSVFLYLHETRMTVCAYSVSNIPRVGRILREVLTEQHRLVLVLDNDAPTDSRPWRPGMTALMAHHDFDDIILPKCGQDFSDVWVHGHA